uniref:Uncharacterized protein n=1 Tax=Setaria digitata TaxID=48799 RepID=A0A915PL44_9BILA
MCSSINSQLFLITFVVATSVLVAKVEANNETELPRNELPYRLLRKIFPNEVNSFYNLTPVQEFIYRQLGKARYSEQISLYYSMRESNNKEEDQTKLLTLLSYGKCRRKLEKLFHKQEPLLKQKVLQIMRFLTMMEQKLRYSIMHQRRWRIGEIKKALNAIDLLADELGYSVRHGRQLRPRKLERILSKLEIINSMLQ